MSSKLKWVRVFSPIEGEHLYYTTENPKVIITETMLRDLCVKHDKHIVYSIKEVRVKSYDPSGVRIGLKEAKEIVVDFLSHIY